MNKELLKYYTEKATALQAAKIDLLKNHLQAVKQDPNVNSLEKRFIYDTLYYSNYPEGCRAVAFAIMNKDNTLNDAKLFTILKRAFYSVFGKNTFNFA